MTAQNLSDDQINLIATQLRDAFENAKLGTPLEAEDTRLFKLYYSPTTQVVCFELSETQGEDWLEEYHYEQFNDVVVGFFSQQEVATLDQVGYAQRIAAYSR